MWAAYSRGDFDASLGAYSEDTVWDDTRFRPDGAVHRGREALVKLVRSWRSVWEAHEFKLEHVVDDGGERVAALLREKGRGRAGGVEIENRWGLVSTVRDGKIVNTTVYRTPEEALEAIGADQAPGSRT